jgi:hypothetical protein
MKAKRAHKRPEKCDRTNQERAVKKILEIEFREKRRDLPGAPKKGRGKEGASKYECKKISEQFGGIFQGR